MNETQGDPASSDPAPPEVPQPKISRQWSLPALSRAVEGGVVLVAESGRVEFVSAGTADLHHGRSFEDWWASIQERLDAHMERARRSGDDGESLRLETETGPLFVRAFPIEDDECTGYLAVIKDQRSLDALEADLRLANQMRRLAGTLSQATHDLKAPLQAMTVNLDILRSELEQQLGEDAPLGPVDVIGRELRRMGRMVQMVFSHTPSPVERLRAFDMRRLVRELATLMRPQARAAGVKLSSDTPREKLVVLAERDHLKQALLNLIVNGLEAIEGEGRLTLELTSDGEFARLAIRDTGHGIAPELRDKLFKLHFTTKASGTGIGLFSARATIERLGGALELESDGRTGTTARVSVPLAAFQAEKEETCSRS